MTVHASFTTVHSPTMCRATHKSDVFSYSECKIVKFFRSFTLDPTGDGLQHPPTPNPQIPTMVFLLATLVKKLAPPKRSALQIYYP